MFEDRIIEQNCFDACQQAVVNPNLCKSIPDKQKVVLKVQGAMGERSKFEMHVNNNLLKFVNFRIFTRNKF